MSTELPNEISLVDQLHRKTFVGRKLGEETRKLLKIEEYDKLRHPLIIKANDSTRTLSSSFLLGLLGPSIVKAGSKENFLDQYKIQLPSVFEEKLSTSIRRALISSSIDITK